MPGTPVAFKPRTALLRRRGDIISADPARMTFTTLTFVLFLPLVFAAYWLTGSNRGRNTVVLAASYVFYGWWDWRFCGLMLATSLLDYGVGRLLGVVEEPRRRKAILLLSVAANLGVLGLFKYWNFFGQSFAAAAGGLGWEVHPLTLHVILPAGISFYTFQAMSYTIDVYRRELPPSRSVLEYLAYISFFPQLVAGPIERAPHLLPQFASPRTFDYDLAVAGCRQVLWGFFKKMALADNLAPIVEATYRSPADSSGAVLAFGTLAFTFQIYCDFSAYSDIAVGVGRLFGVDLMRNFHYPYLAESPADFWRRWHISLSRWFRDYVYLPLGGSRVSRGRWLFNVAVTFLLSGLWHGANWTYVVWGAWHAAGVMLQGLLPLPRLLGSAWSRPLRIAGTFLFVSLGWIFFRAVSLGDALLILRKIFARWEPGSVSALRFLATADPLRPIVLWLVVALIVLEWLQRARPHPLEIPGWPTWARWTAYTAVLWGALLLTARNPGQFIYFQF